VLARQSAEWQRETGERLAQAALAPHGEITALTPAMESEIGRIAREHSQAAVDGAVQQICDSVERVLAGILEEMARGMHRGPAPEAAPSRETILTAGSRPAIPQAAGPGNGAASGSGEANGAGGNGAGAPEADEAAVVEARPEPADQRRAAADRTTKRHRKSERGASAEAGTPVQEAAAAPEPWGAVATERRGPTTLEITAFGKTYAFPMAPERANAVVEAWESGRPVPEAWLHESGITTARLQPLLDRFVLRRQSEKDGAVAYLFDPRGTSARFAVRNGP
jgi:hypothetical protein